MKPRWWARLVAAACTSSNNDAADEPTTESTLPACAVADKGPAVEPEGSSGRGELITSASISTEVIELDPAEAEGLCDGVEDDDGNPVPHPTSVVGDVAVELTTDGEVVQEWAFSDYFDPIERPGSDLCKIGAPLAPPNWFYPQEDGPRDWTHANAAARGALQHRPRRGNRSADLGAP